MNQQIAFFNVCASEGFGSDEGPNIRPSAHLVQANLERLLAFAERNQIRVVSTRCLKGGKAPPVGPHRGEELLVIDVDSPPITWNQQLSTSHQVLIERPTKSSGPENVRTGMNDVFFSNPATKSLVHSIDVPEWVVFGMSLGGCSGLVVRGLLKENRRVAIVSDAVTTGKYDAEKALESLIIEGASAETTEELLTRITTMDGRV